VISDNGIGFNSKEKKKGIGIQNMLLEQKSAMANFRLIQKKEKAQLSLKGARKSTKTPTTSLSR
jgi:signal transduction histidine kinase